MPAGKTVAVRVQTLEVVGVATPIAWTSTGLPAGMRAAFDPPLVLPGGDVDADLTAEPDAGTSARLRPRHDRRRRAGNPVVRLDVRGRPAVALHGPKRARRFGKAHVEVSAPPVRVSPSPRCSLLVDGAEVATSTGPPSDLRAGHHGVANGAHNLGAIAVDEIGNSAGRAPLRIEVRNKGTGGGGCASAGSGEPLLALARCPRCLRAPLPPQFTLPGWVSGKGAISASNCCPSSVTIR